RVVPRHTPSREGDGVFVCARGDRGMGPGLATGGSVVTAAEEKTRFAAVGSGFDLPELEHRVLDLWERERSFDALRKKNAGGPRYSFIDGPITANIEAMGVHH